MCSPFVPNSEGKKLLFPIFPCFHSLIFLHCDDDEYNSLCLYSFDSTMICSIRCVHYAIHIKRLLLLVSFSIYAIRGYFLNKSKQEFRVAAYFSESCNMTMCQNIVFARIRTGINKLLFVLTEI